jgi:hypothetical protein
MRRFVLAVSTVLIAALAVPLAPAPGGAQATTDVYVVHGLNLQGQASPDEGGTNVTVCSGDAVLIADFAFGETVGPVPLPSGQTVPVQVYEGAGQDCAEPELPPLIDQDVTPDGAAVALVATRGPGEEADLELLAVPLDVGCVAVGQGRVTGAHAAAAPPVSVLLGGARVGELAYGDELTAELPVGGGYEIAVVLGETTLVETTLSVLEGEYTSLFVVGNQVTQGPITPVVALTLTIDLAICDQPVEPTTTTTAPSTPPASAAAARPRFTG